MLKYVTYEKIFQILREENVCHSQNHIWHGLLSLFDFGKVDIFNHIVLSYQKVNKYI